MAKNILKLLLIFILGAIGGVWGSYFLAPYLSTYFSLSPSFLNCPIYVTKTEKLYIRENLALKQGIEKVENSLFGIVTETKGKKVLKGFGVILTADGLAVTLAELVPKDFKIKLYLGEKEIKNYKIIKRDLNKNLALIEFETKKALPTVSFKNMEDLYLGERVFLLGFLLKKDELQKFVNEGIVNSLQKDSFEINIFDKKAKGAPLFDIEGNLIGISELKKEGKLSIISISEIKRFASI